MNERESEKERNRGEGKDEREKTERKEKEQAAEVLSVGDRIRLFVYTENHRRDSSIVPRGTGFAFPPPGALIEQTTTFPAKLVGPSRSRVKRD